MKLALAFSLALMLQLNPLQAQNDQDTSKQEQNKSFSLWAHMGLGSSRAIFQESKAGLLFGLGTLLKQGITFFLSGTT